MPRKFYNGVSMLPLNQPPRVAYAPPALRRAVMQTFPDFYSLPEDEAEQFIVSLSPEDSDELELAFAEHYFNTVFDSPEHLEDYLNRSGEDRHEEFHNILSLFYGIGDDCFFIEDFSKLFYSCDTLDEYARRDFAARRKNGAAYSEKGAYRGDLYSAPVHFVYKGAPRFAILYSVAEYLAEALDEHAFYLVKERIPHSYFNDDASGEGIADGEEAWGMHLNANGREQELSAIQERVRDYINARREELAAETPEASAVTFIEATELGGGKRLDIVFTGGTEALSAVRLRHFMRDCRTMEQGGAGLAERAEQEKARFMTFFEKAYEETRQQYPAQATPQAVTS